jgi:hypothetical protein
MTDRSFFKTEVCHIFYILLSVCPSCRALDDEIEIEIEAHINVFILILYYHNSLD